jgi:hypothetical protein
MLDFDHPLKGLLKPCLSIHIRVIVSNSMMISPYEFGARRGVRRTTSFGPRFLLRCPVDKESQGQLDDVLG